MLIRLQIFLVGLGLNLLSLVAPRRAGDAAFSLFTTPRSRRPTPEPMQPVMEAAETFEVEADGVTLAAYRWPASPADTDVADDARRVLLVHGWESRAGRVANWVEPLRDAGFEVVAFDGPAHGASGGEHANPMRFARGIRAVADATGPLYGVMGHSMGAAAAFCAHAGGPWSDDEAVRFERAVFVAGAESGVTAVEQFCDVLGLRDRLFDAILDAAERRNGLPMHTIDGRRLLAGDPLPILWFHDPADDEVPFSGAENVADIAGGVRIVETPGLGHHRIVRDEQVIADGVAFLNDSFLND